MSILTTIALVGVTGGAGTTRLSLELVAALATDGRDVAVLDVAFATQGFSDYVSGTLDPDTTALVINAVDVPLESGLIALEIDTEGRITVCSAAVPFKRLARAVAPDAAQVFEGRIAEAADGFDHVLVDTPPLALNQVVAAAAACNRVALVAPATDHGADAAGRLSAWATDIDTDIDTVIPTFGAPDDADVVMSETEVTGLADASACHEDVELAAGIATVAGVPLDIETGAMAATDSVLGSVSEYARR